jgi:hypothetical protein
MKEDGYAGHVTQMHGDKINVYKTLIGKPVVKHNLGDISVDSTIILNVS